MPALRAERPGVDGPLSSVSNGGGSKRRNGSCCLTIGRKGGRDTRSFTDSTWVRLAAGALLVLGLTDPFGAFAKPPFAGGLLTPGHPERPDLVPRIQVTRIKSGETIPDGGNAVLAGAPTCGFGWRWSTAGPAQRRSA